MDYEKKYKEALSRARAACGTGAYDDLTLEFIFPELAESEDERTKVRDFMMKQFFRPISPDLADALADAIIEVNKIALNKKQKESEDERIRKAIVCGMNALKGQKKETFATVPINDCLAWLEKQKDILGERAKNITANMFEDGIKGIQRELIEFLSNTVNASWVDIIRSADAYAERIRNTIKKQKEQKPSINIDQLKSLMLQYLQEAANEKDDLSIEADTDKWARKILGYNFEQKPAEWSEKHIAGIFEKVGLAKIVREQGNDDLTNALQDAMLELSKVGNIEWSEEDEHRRKEAIYFLESAKKHYADTSEIEKTIDWLKSLRPQPKIEWSEEDEKMKERIIDILNRTFSVYSALGTSTTRPSCPTYKDEIAWLKSLHPSWKPSEQ